MSLFCEVMIFFFVCVPLVFKYLIIDMLSCKYLDAFCFLVGFVSLAVLQVCHLAVDVGD